jgi:uncharacterized protein YecE (DUF72 family)
MSILIGTSGWSYPSGKGTWNGVFYPRPRPRGFDELAFYAQRFGTVEVNSTFYRMPEPAQTASWCRRTPDTFQFAIKLFQKFTHPDMYLARDGVKDWDVSRSDVDLFRLGIAPLVDAGRLAAVLLQFPASFHAIPETRDYLVWLLRALEGYPTAVELRHGTWTETSHQTAALLSAHRAAWVVGDSPVTRDESHADTGELVYIRMHGRNAVTWWHHDHAEDRYNYLYSAEELAPFAAKARQAASAGRRVVIYFNNHFSAKAVANADILREQAGDSTLGG